jgi:hypothetical protein
VGDASEVGEAGLKGKAEKEAFILLGKGEGGGDQTRDGGGPGASVRSDEVTRAERRAGGHESLWTVGDTQGGCGRGSGGGRQDVYGTLGRIHRCLQ